jgi:hypothetical protein
VVTLNLLDSPKLNALLMLHSSTNALNSTVLLELVIIASLTFIAKYTLDGLKKQKNDISKVISQKKKDSKGADKCEEEIAKSKEIDESIHS